MFNLKPMSNGKQLINDMVVDPRRSDIYVVFTKKSKTLCFLTIFHMEEADSTRLQIVSFITSVRDAA